MESGNEAQARGQSDQRINSDRITETRMVPKMPPICL